MSKVLTTKEGLSNEDFELDYERKQKNTVKAIGDKLLDGLIITQGVKYPVKSKDTKDISLVILYNQNNVKLGYYPAPLNELTIAGETFTVVDRYGASLDTDMSREGVDKFLSLMGSECFSNEVMNKKDLWARVKKEIEYYYQFFDPRYYLIITAYVIGTYFHDFFSAFPYLWLNGFKKSGKTQLGNLIANLSYCGVASANMSLASLFRMVQKHSPTLFLDEMEQFNNPKEKQEYRSLLNSGYKRMGSDVFRINNENNMQLERHKSYCPKILASINDLQNVLRSRTIPIPCRKNIDPRYNSADREPSFDKFVSLRDDLYIARLLFAFAIITDYQELKSTSLFEDPPLKPFGLFEPFEPFEKTSENAKDTKDAKDPKGKKGGLLPFEHQIDGRFWDMIKSLLVVGKHFAPEDEYNQLKQILFDVNKRIMVDEEENEEFIMLAVLKEAYEQQTMKELLVDDNGIDLWIELQDLTDLFKEKIGWTKCSWKRVKNYMIQLGFDKAEDQDHHPENRRRTMRIRYDVLKQKLSFLNYHLKPYNKKENGFQSDFKKIITTIQNINDCCYNDIIDTLDDISGLKSKLAMLQKQGYIIYMDGVYKVVN